VLKLLPSIAGFRFVVKAFIFFLVTDTVSTMSLVTVGGFWSFVFYAFFSSELIKVD